VKPVSFALLASLVCGVLLAAVWIGSSLGWFLRPTHFIEMAIITMITSAYLYRMLANMTRPQVFVNVYLATVAMKLVFFSVLLFVLRFLEPDTLVPNAIFMLVAYVIFTALEVVVLFKKVNR
jgi:hypothetical protein